MYKIERHNLVTETIKDILYVFGGRKIYTIDTHSSSYNSKKAYFLNTEEEIPIHIYTKLYNAHLLSIEGDVYLGESKPWYNQLKRFLPKDPSVENKVITVYTFNEPLIRFRVHGLISSGDWKQTERDTLKTMKRNIRINEILSN